MISVNDTIIWAPGVQRADFALVQEGQKVLVLTYEKL